MDLPLITDFLAVFNFISSVIFQSVNNKLTYFECIMLTMMKLRLNLSNYDLAFQSISETTAGRVFSKWISAMDSRLSAMIRWLDRQKAMLFCFRRHCSSCVVSIIDYFELLIETPSSLLATSCTYSTYNTAKYMSK